jgi:hypothetical protein
MNKPSKKAVKSRWQAALTGFLSGLFLDHERWRRHVPTKHQLTFDRLHGVIAQKTELFLVPVLFNFNSSKFLPRLQGGKLHSVEGLRVHTLSLFLSLSLSLSLYIYIYIYIVPTRNNILYKYIYLFIYEFHIST